ncbi:uncharacterized protein LOC133197930 [Saccostrea echinata]|uniref:uncharacterized protein LOC133174499 n=1 Tax=Saccostrea echinata TaxID=191078 RepID=UPI002A7F6FD2|nr:uncharacterized protein LOC133174499 [Saccostrea echinata]XP_061190088.1 uncharacterized protein LOC133197928 [Saccostrea echinata]XP_061190090.1 uncharacterized protein LOC133197930 [Saccostrea echinata]
MNPYQNLSFNPMDYNYPPNGSYAPIQNPTPSTVYVPPSVSQSCDFNCVCCLKLKAGQTSSCNTSKTTVGTQTMLEVPQGLDPEGFWMRGTYEHALLQKSVNNALQKYKLSGRKDSNWEAATNEIMNSYQCDMPQTPTNRRKVQDRMRKAVYWGRFYEKKEKEAVKRGMTVKAFLRHSKQHPQETSSSEPSGLLEEQCDTEVADRGDARDMTAPTAATFSSDSDSDTPLAVYRQKTKGKK